MTNPLPQEQVVTIDGKTCVIGIGPAIRKGPTPRFDYDLSQDGVGNYTRNIYCTYAVMNQGFDVDYTIESDRKITMDSVYDECYFGITLNSDSLSIDRSSETSSSPAAAHYKCVGTINVGGSYLGVSVSVNLRAAFQNDKLKVTVNGSKF